MIDVVGGILLMVVWAFAAACIFVVPAWLLWNWLVPVIFGLPEVSLLQCLGLMLLSGMLFRPKIEISTGD